MGKSTRTLQSPDNRSLLLELYKQRDESSSTGHLVRIQASIDQIVAQNYLNYVNS